jgi:hypothetical protein
LPTEFYVHISVHLGNVHVQFTVQPDAHYMYALFLYIFALHVSCAIYTHPQEHKLQSTAIGMCNGYGMLIHCSRDWLGQPHTFSTVKCEGVPVSTCCNGLTYHNHYTHLWLYSAVCAPEDGCK